MSANKESGLKGSGLLYDKYLRCCDQATAIEEKLSQKRIASGKRESLQFHLKDLQKRIIPAIVRNIDPFTIISS
ncbi:MAG: hypothetical protein ABIH48_00570 [Candidatus Falkowbacteria bacterium]